MNKMKFSIESDGDSTPPELVELTVNGTTHLYTPLEQIHVDLRNLITRITQNHLRGEVLKKIEQLLEHETVEVLVEQFNSSKEKLDIFEGTQPIGE